MSGGRIKDSGHSMCNLQSEDVPELENTYEVQKSQNKNWDGSKKLNQYQNTLAVVTVNKYANERCKDQAWNRLE